ncbi:MAG: hypothetical protein AUG91_01315 [Actinobacteria bacterium 13_1_20CM_4_69_9]|nr:MAG: hypothetical protein AUG91_01315 [Actinobacteria bacterium 13_1_20CM_4_69_9]
MELKLIPREELERARALDDLPLLADMCRANALVAVKRAGSGHLGSSFSAMDVVVHLFYRELNTAALGFDHPDRDVYFSSKGHDVPGLYAVLHALGVLPPEQLLRLRRLGGLDGHPDVGVPGIEANSGSLGMGISKGRGIAWAKRFLGRGGRVVVMTGDGELQEGQNFEGLQAAAAHSLGNLWVVVDRNELQSDKLTDEILPLGDIEAKLRAFGWHVATCDGHDHDELARVFAELHAAGDMPKALVARTVKGKGVSFMEHPQALSEGGGTYRWHAGAPDDDSFARAHAELLARIRERLPDLRLAAVDAIGEGSIGEPESGITTRTRVTDEYVAAAYGDALLELADDHPHLVVLDADLASDCRIRPFELAHPERFHESGIAEQDMVSAAAGMARQGLLPVVNSFAANMTIVQPGNADETRALVRWAVDDAAGNVAIRLAIGPSPRRLELPEAAVGRGAVIHDGTDALLLAYGPVMLHEALTAAELLDGRLQVVNMPWLNRADVEWVSELAEPFGDVFVLEDHAPVGALGDSVRRALDGRAVTVFGVEGWPACGTPGEALRFHGLDGASLADRIALALRARASS